MILRILRNCPNHIFCVWINPNSTEYAQLKLLKGYEINKKIRKCTMINIYGRCAQKRYTSNNTSSSGMSKKCKNLDL